MLLNPRPVPSPQKYRLQLIACLQLLTGKLNQGCSTSVLTEAINEDIQFLVKKSNEEVHFEQKGRDSSRTLKQANFVMNKLSIKMCTEPTVHLIFKYRVIFCCLL